MDKIFAKIHDVIQKNNEDIILELKIKNYDMSNFFVALVFNKNVEKFKILYVPIDLVKKVDLVEEYFCYQFIFMNLVNGMLKVISDFQDKGNNVVYENNISDDSEYYIEFNTYKPLDSATYKFKQFINPEFDFFFDIIVTLFEHLPNIMDELRRNILAQFNTRYQLLKYNKSYSFRLKTDDLGLLFDSSIFKYDKINVQFIEKIGDNYYGVVRDNKVLVNSSQGRVRIYSGKMNPLGEEMYLFFKNIKDGTVKKFYRLDYTDKEKVYYLLCYGFDFSSNEFLIHNNLYDYDVTLKDVINKKVKIHGMDEENIKKISDIIRDKYIESKADEIIKYTFVEE